MTAEREDNAYETNLEFFDKLVSTIPDIERKGATMPYTSVNGHMFSFLTKDGKLALRLPVEEREGFVQKYGTKLIEQYRKIMKEYVEVPDDLLRETQAIKKYFDVSYAYVGSLKPKPTKKSKKQGSS